MDVEEIKFQILYFNIFHFNSFLINPRFLDHDKSSFGGNADGAIVRGNVKGIK